MVSFTDGCLHRSGTINIRIGIRAEEHHSVRNTPWNKIYANALLVSSLIETAPCNLLAIIDNYSKFAEAILLWSKLSYTRRSVAHFTVFITNNKAFINYISIQKVIESKPEKGKNLVFST